MFRNTQQRELRTAQSVARVLVRVWPAETRDWGLAFEAEFSAIETGGAAFSWLIGGVMLFLREWWKHLWRVLGRPIGANAEESQGSFTNHSRLPRTPLWVMLLLLLSSAALLLHPEVWQALGSLRSAYTRTEEQPSQWSSVKKLRRISASNRDPQLLALLSLLSNDEEERMRLSEEAIGKDSSLTWLDYEQSLLPANDLSRQHYLPAARLERLQKWDPQNSVPHLLAAEVISKPARIDAVDALDRGRTGAAWEKTSEQDPKWISEMSAAFSAPKYDSYLVQTIELVQTVSSKFSVRDPDIALFVLSQKRIMQFDVVRAYINILMERGAILEKAGDKTSSIAAYSQVLQFIQRMLLSRTIPSEEYFARGIGEQACEKLQGLYQSAGRRDEASLVAFQLAKWKAERDPKLLRYVPLHYRQAQWNSLAWSGLLINLGGLALLIVGPFAVLSFFYVYWHRKIALQDRGRIDFWASIFADGAPWLLLASCMLIYFAYHPYASVCESFMKGGLFSPDMETFVAAALVPHALPDGVQLIRSPYWLWFGTTAILCLIAVYLLWRLTIRRTPST
jgi:hypothetical protein